MHKMKVTVNGKEMYLDGYLKSNLDIIKDQINNKDTDMVGVVDGFEGVGKSVLAMQCGYYVDPTLKLDRICFNAEEFKNAVLKAKKGECVIFDEAITGTFNREAITQMNVLLVKMMAQIRQKNLFVLLVLPTFFDLDKYFALWRSKFLLHCHFGNNFQRGFFKFASIDKKKNMYVTGQKLYIYPKQKSGWDFWGRFTNNYVVNEKLYRKKKDEGLIEQDYERVSIRRVRLQRDSMIVLLSNFGFTQEEVSEATDMFDEGVTQQTVFTILSKKAYKLHNTDTIIKLKTKYEKAMEKKLGVVYKNNDTNEEKIQGTVEHNHLDDTSIDETKFNNDVLELNK